MEQQNQLEINKKVEEQEQSVEQVLSTLGNAFRQTEDQRTKRIEQFKHIILKQYPSSKDYVENRENIISALFNGYCTPEEKARFAESERTKGMQGKSEEEQEVARIRKNNREKLRKHYVRIHEQLYGFTLESTSEKRMSNGSQKKSNSPVSLESPLTSSENLSADGQESPSLNPYPDLLPEIRERYGQPVHNPNYEQHHFDLPFNAVVVAPTGGGKTTFVYNFIKRCGDETGPNTFNHIYLCVKMIDQQLYQNLLQQNNCVTHVTLDNIPRLDQFQNRQNILFVFDDFVSYAKSKDHKVVEEFFTTGRHLNITSIYITQKFAETPSIIRENALVAVMLQIDLKEARRALHNYVSFECGIDGLFAMFKYAVQDDEKSSRMGYTNVFIVDKKTRDKSKRYRKNFREFLKLDDFYPPQVQPSPHRTPYSSAKKAPQMARPVVSPGESMPARNGSSPQTPASNGSSPQTPASNGSPPQISATQFLIEESESSTVLMDIESLSVEQECMIKLEKCLFEAQRVLTRMPFIDDIKDLCFKINYCIDYGVEAYCVQCQDNREFVYFDCNECKFCEQCGHSSKCSKNLDGLPELETLSIN